MGSRVILFLVLSLTIIVFYPLLLEKMGIIAPVSQVEEHFGEGDFTILDESEPTPTISEDPVPSELSKIILPLDGVPALEQDITVETDLYRAVFSSAGGVLRSWTLKHHLTSDPEDRQPIDLVVNPDGLYPKSLEILSESSEPTHSFSTVLYSVEGGDLELTEFEPTGNLKFWYQDPQTGASISKLMVFSNDSYVVDFELETTGIPDPYVLSLGTNFGVTEWNDQTFIGINGPATLIDGEIDKSSPEVEVTREGLVGWAALQDKYFISAIIPDISGDENFSTRKVKIHPRDEKLFSVGVLIDPSQGTKTEKYKIYAGPKSYNGLRDLQVGLEDTIDFGWFIYGSWSLVRAVAKPLFSVLSFLYDYTHNYGLAIILLTIGIKILFAPLTYKAYVSMKSMAKLQPKMMEIQKK